MNEVEAYPAEYGWDVTVSATGLTDGILSIYEGGTIRVRAGGPEFDRLREWPKNDGLWAKASFWRPARGGWGICIVVDDADVGALSILQEL